MYWMICKNNKSQVHLPLEGLRLAWTSFILIGIDNLPIRWILCWKLLEMLRLWWMTTQADLESTFSWNSSKAWVRKSIQLTVYLSVCLSVCLSVQTLVHFIPHVLYASLLVLLFRFCFFIGSNVMYIPLSPCFLPCFGTSVGTLVRVLGGWVGQRAGRLVGRFEDVCLASESGSRPYHQILTVGDCSVILFGWLGNHCSCSLPRFSLKCFLQDLVITFIIFLCDL